MKIKIAKNGTLQIWRVNTWKHQFCMAKNHGAPCSDVCPAFREPAKNISTGVVNLELCFGTLTAPGDEFTDERHEAS